VLPGQLGYSPTLNANSSPIRGNKKTSVNPQDNQDAIANDKTGENFGNDSCLKKFLLGRFSQRPWRKRH
jgi:hypothetical protein